MALYGATTAAESLYWDDTWVRTLCVGICRHQSSKRTQRGGVNW